MIKRLLTIVLACGLVLPTTVVLAANDGERGPRLESPNGGESWKTGTTRAIRWHEGLGFNFVKMQLLKRGKHVLWITKNTKNDGKYTWKIPSSVASSSSYKIKITATSNKTLTDTSDKKFSITRIGGGGSLNVVSPDGGESWNGNTKHAIKWDKGNAGTHVKIQLVKSGRHHLWISKKTKNDGKYTWKIPSSFSTSSNYKVKISSTSNITVNDKSDASFTITDEAEVCSRDVYGACRLTLIKPGAGENLTVGKSYEIKWRKGDQQGSFIKIKLCKVDCTEYLGTPMKWISKKTKNDGRYVWKVSPLRGPNPKYRICLYYIDNTRVTCSSFFDRFTISK